MERGEPDERIARLLSDRRNLAILAELDETAGFVDVTLLAERLVERDEEPTVPHRTPERLQITLRHEALPALANAGLVAFDAETDRVSLGASVEDLGDHRLEAVRTSVEALWGADRSAEIDVLEGREAVIDHGQALFEKADDELFVLMTTDGLLEPGCLERMQAAIDRGVAVAVGSGTIGVRDLVRRKVPDATIWEPQRDQLRDPSTHPALGRLVVADREAVMVGRLDDRDEEATRERAIAAEGPTNPLVVLVRELLGPRFDHLDYQSEDFRSQLPF